MKKLYFSLILLCLCVWAGAQENSGFYLLPRQPGVLKPGEQLSLSLHYAPVSGNDPLKSVVSGSGLSPYVLGWTVNGKKLDALSPGDGELTMGHGFDLSTATYRAPVISPVKNPVAISVQIKTRDGSSLWLVCNVKIAEAQYKITMDAVQTLQMAGQVIELQGQCFANLKAAADGTYYMEPVDKSRNMQIKVERAVLINKEAASEELTTPLTYDIPFLFTVEKNKATSSPGDATMCLYYTSPQQGKVTWKINGNGHTVIRTLDIDQGTLTYSPGTSVQIGVPGNTTKNAIAMSGATDLDLIASIHRMDINKTKDDLNRNIVGADQMKELAIRMQTNEKTPGYFNTKQGKADLQKLMALRQKIGGNMSNTSAGTKSINTRIDNQYMSDPAYVNSDAFKADRINEYNSEGQDAFHYMGKAPIAKVTPKSASLRIEGKFDPGKSPAFYQEFKAVTPGGGEQATRIKIKVEKIN